MKTTIAGGTGFIGRALEKYLVKKGHEVLILTRNPKRENEIYWDGQTKGDWCTQIDGTEVLINLSGRSVDCRYTPKNKKEILLSRTLPTFSLHDYITEAKQQPKLWMNASSATTYIHADNQVMTESNGIIGDDFSMNICKKWEEAFFARAYPEMRQVSLRTSIVLGENGGAFPKLKRIVKLGLGGRQGKGDQKVSWIHISDFCEAVNFIIQNRELCGAINITSPEPIENHSFMQKLRKRFGIPFGLNQSRAILEIGAALIGTETELLLKSRNVYPEKLLRSGFKFKYDSISTALISLA